MRNPGETGDPMDYLDVLNEEELESGDEIFEEIELNEYENFAAELDRLNLNSGSEFFIVQDDGSLALMARREPAADVVTSGGDSSEFNDTPMLVPVASNSVSSNSNGVGAKGYKIGRRGRPARRGRGGRVNDASRGNGEHFDWARGEPLVESFASDEELPASLRAVIQQLTDRRERSMRARREANVKEDESDAENGEFAGEEFVWKGMGEWNGVKETFLPESSGPTRVYENAYDAFRSYWDDSLLSHIVQQTNKCAHEIQSEQFRRTWMDTNMDEILILFAFWIMLGVVKMPTIKSCFSKLSILRAQVFQHMFTEKRFWDLCRAFSLANGSRDANDPDNVLYPMGPVINEINAKFQQNYRLHQDICIHESLTLWKGRAGFKHYIKTKAARFGIKTYQLCESSSGYLWTFFIYADRRTTNSTLPSNISTVVNLVQPLLNLGHVLYMDNWFNSPLLARYLKRQRTDCVGTLRSCRRHVPAVVQRTPLAEGEYIARQCGDIMIVALQDRKRITCISTFHDVSQVYKQAARPAQYKLQLIEDYNHGMGGVDRLDQMLEPYSIERKQSIKWSRKLFIRLLSISVQNARILLEKSSKSTINALSFRLALLQSIIDNHLGQASLQSPQKPPQRKRQSFPQFPEQRLTERHFIRRIPITAEMRAAVRHASNLGRRQCVWCSANGRKNKRTAYECPECKVALCLDDCFEEFHTVP